MALSQILDAGGRQSLVFYCGDLPADEAAVGAGYEPNGYFWEAVARFLAPDLVAAVELDSEGGMFDAVGDRADIERLQDAIEPVLASREAIRVLIDSAESVGFQLDG